MIRLSSCSGSFLKIHLLLYMSVLFACIFVCHVHAVPKAAREFQMVNEPPCRCRELNPGSLEERPVLFTTNPFLQLLGWLVFVVNLTQRSITWEEGPSLKPVAILYLRNCSDQIGPWTCLWGIVLIAGWYRRAQATVDSASAIPGQAVLGYLRKLAKHERAREWANKQVFLYGFCFTSYLNFCLYYDYDMGVSVSQITSFLLRLLLVWVFYHDWKEMRPATLQYTVHT